MASLLPRLDPQGLSALAQGRPLTAFLAGVNGTGMRGLASFLLQEGWQVWGADLRPLEDSDPLRSQGLQVLRPMEMPPPVSLCIRSAAVPVDAADVLHSRQGGARGLRYAEALGEISRVRPVLAVAGTHGKTTCAGWIAYGLQEAQKPCGYLVGGYVPQLQGSASWGDPSTPLIMESCEFDRSFWELRPYQVALTNVEAEHPDTYPGGLPEVEAAFRKFLAGVVAQGKIFAGPEAPDYRQTGGAQWVPVKNLSDAIEVGLAGRHNRKNAALVATVLNELGLHSQEILHALSTYQGAARRMEVLGPFLESVVISDYAHHPTEIAATLQAAKERYPHAKIYAVFQPHQARRFTAYRENFVQSLDDANGILLLEIYRARDPEDLQPKVEELLEPLECRDRERGAHARPMAVAPQSDQALQWLREQLQPGDVVLCLGAGNVDDFARKLVAG